MPTLDESVLGDPARLRAVERARRMLPARPLPLAGLAQLAARLLHAPIALVTLVDADEETFAGTYGAPASLIAGGRAALPYSVCKYAVSLDHPQRSEDMSADPELRRHPLATEYGVRAFLVVPLRDADDRPVGAVSVLDLEPRQWTEDDLVTLLQIGEVLGPIPVDERQAATLAVSSIDGPTILDQLLEAFIAVTGDGQIVGWNKAADTIFGWTAAEILGRSVDVLVVPERASAVTAAVLQTILTGASPSVRRVEALHRKGNRIRLRVRFGISRGPGGAVVCLFVKDETAQVEAEAQAAQAHHFTDTLLDSLQTGVIACDQTGRIVVVNRAMRELHQLPDGWPAGDLHTATMELASRVSHPDGAPLRPEEFPLWQALAGMPVHERAVRLLVPGSPVRHLEVNARPLREPDGTRVGAVATLQDITADQRSSQSSACELRVARVLARADTLAQAAPALAGAVAETLGWVHVTLWLMDERAGVLRSAGVWTAQGLDSTDLLPEQITPGMGITGIAWQTKAPVWVPDLRNPPPGIAELMGGSGEEVVERGVRAILAVPIPGSPDPVGVLICVGDAPQPDDALLEAILTGVAAQIGYYTSRHREQALAHELTRSKEDYIALVGHELRTPLTSIASYTELLASSAPSWPESDRMMLEVIGRNAAQLRALVEELLDLAAVESGHLLLDPQEIDFAELVDVVVAAAESSAVKTDLEDPLLLWGDPERLRQVVEELLANAIKCSAEGGRVDVSLRTDGKTAVLDITDQGPGLPADEHGRVLDALYRSSDAQHSGIRGAGLGLTLARALVEAHGGTLRLGPGASQGTVATVCLPLAAT